VEKIHDSYIDVNDQELFFCETNITVKWLSASSIEKNKIKEYYKQQHRKYADSTCNTLKKNVTSCDVKCKTRGILLAATNCGIVVSFRELYGSESLTQVSMLFLDSIDYAKGISASRILFLIKYKI